MDKFLNEEYLMFASAGGKIDIVKELIKNNTDVNAKDIDGWTALMFASAGGKIDIVKELIKAGADVYITNNMGKTAVDISLHANNFEIAKEICNFAKLKYGSSEENDDFDDDKDDDELESRFYHFRYGFITQEEEEEIENNPWGPGLDLEEFPPENFPD